MASGPRVDDLGGSFRRIFGDGTLSGMDEGELLQRFAARRDPAALEALVVRHGPMVLGVCRRVLVQWDASEDAFQATFLVLARRAGTIRDPDRLGPWLHGVAHRVALRSRAERARRQARERTGTEEPAMATTSATAEPEFDRAELRATLDEEVRRLPTKFREPIVLCYLDGLTHDEAAAHLRCPVGTVRSRLATGRDKLRDRLVRRGVTVPSAVFAGVLTAETASAAVSPALLLTTVRASTAFASGMAGATAAGLVSATVASLAEGVTTTMIVSKWKIVAGLALVGIMTLGVGAATAQRLGGPAPGENVAQKPAETPEAELSRLRQQTSEWSARAKALEMEIKTLRDQLEAAENKALGQQPEPASSKDANRALSKTSTTTIQGQAIGGGMMGGGGGPGMRAAFGGGGAGMGGRGMGGGSVGVLNGVLLAGEGTPDMVGMASGKPNIPIYFSDEFVIVHKSKSDRVDALSTETGQWTSYKVPKNTDVVPIYKSPSLVALMYTGEAIGQIATFVPELGRWFPLELKEPGHGGVTPWVEQYQAIYLVGRRVYAFSAMTRTWDILELPEGAKPAAMVFPIWTTVEYGDHIYIFNAKTGKWSDFDARSGQVVAPEKQ